ncbi:hypothetical protein CHH70_01210 [Shouchella clausii]|nr:hypothetical protein CHH70_01210 [Shouchella clausii]
MYSNQMIKRMVLVDKARSSPAGFPDAPRSLPPSFRGWIQQAMVGFQRKGFNMELIATGKQNSADCKFW